jgi:hypothetical protein
MIVDSSPAAAMSRTDTLQSYVERFGHSEVARDDFDIRRQRRRRLGAMREGADRHARVY